MKIFTSLKTTWTLIIRLVSCWLYSPTVINFYSIHAYIPGLINGGHLAGFTMDATALTNHAYLALFNNGLLTCRGGDPNI